MSGLKYEMLNDQDFKIEHGVPFRKHSASKAEQMRKLLAHMKEGDSVVLRKDYYGSFLQEAKKEKVLVKGRYEDEDQRRVWLVKREGEK